MSETRARVLIVDDEMIKRSVLEDELRAAGYAVATAPNPNEAWPLLERSVFDVVLTDIRMPGQDGLSFLGEIKKREPEQSVIVMTAYGTVETAVAAMKLGAFDYLQKPFSTEELLLKLDKLLHYQELASENEALRRQLSVSREETRLIGQSAAMRNVLALVHAVAGSDSTVLIEGESGTGKELVARLIHETSSRASGPFVAVSCAALPKEIIEAELFGYEVGAFSGAIKRRLGRIELAHGGTLFLDDVDDVPLDIQVKLLRVLQERAFERLGGEQTLRVNIRVIAAAKSSLATLVAQGRFREDLFYRLSVVRLPIPPLRERRDDVPLLVRHFLEEIAIKLNRGKLTISPNAIAILQEADWPGNVRQLEHVIESMVVLNAKQHFDECDLPELTAGDEGRPILSLRLEGLEKVNLSDVIAEAEMRVINWAVQKAGGNLARAAEMLGIPRTTLQYKLTKLKQP